MRVEIDQSGKLEKLDTGTAIAFSNGKHYAVFLTAGTKRTIIQFLKKDTHYKTDFAPVFFAHVILLLLKETKITSCIIDEEYTGKGTVIEKVLLRLYTKFALRPPDVYFGRIGKHSRAHDVAWATHRTKGKGINTKVIDAKEVIKLLSKQK